MRTILILLAIALVAPTCFAIGGNVVANYGFEDGPGPGMPSNWTVVSGSSICTFTQYADPHNGTYSLRITKDSSGVNCDVDSDAMPASVGTTYTSTFYTKTDTSANVLQVSFSFYDSSGHSLSPSATCDTKDALDWEQGVCTGTAPLNTATVKVHLHTDLNTGHWGEFDDVLLNPLT